LSYATITHLQARFQGFSFGASSKPTQTQAEQWLAEAEAMIDGALSAAGLISPCVNANGILILRAWTCDFAEGHVRNALASSANDPSNTAGQPLIDKFSERIGWILDKPQMAGNMFEGGSPPSSSTRFRSYPRDNDDDLSVDDGDFDPTFTTSGDQW
jgi:hypothetical protein